MKMRIIVSRGRNEKVKSHRKKKIKRWKLSFVITKERKVWKSRQIMKNKKKKKKRVHGISLDVS